MSALGDSAFLLLLHKGREEEEEEEEEKEKFDAVVLAKVTNGRSDDAYTCTVGRLLTFSSAPSFTCSAAAAACFPFLPAAIDPTHPAP